MKKLLLPLAIVCSVFTTSCEKDNGTTMRTAVITSGRWKLATMVQSETGKSDMDITGTAGGYIQNRYRFMDGGEFIRLSGDQYQDSAITGTWIFKDADTRLIIADSNLGGDYKITSFTNDMMVLQNSIQASESDTATVSITKTLRRAD